MAVYLLKPLANSGFARYYVTDIPYWTGNPDLAGVVEVTFR